MTYYDDHGARRREFVFAVKNCRTVKFGNFAARDGREVAITISQRRASQMSAYLRGALLVPIPPSGAGVDKPLDNLWPGTDLARMLAEAYQVEWCELLRRHTPISKSEAGPRNLRRHVESIELTGPVPRQRIILIDDVVTSGSTMCGCAEVVWAAAPDASIEGFAVAFTSDGKTLKDFATREYEWHGLNGRPRNHLVPGPLDKR